MTRERLASLCTVVFDSAADDEIAQSILAAAARDLAEMVAVLSRRLDLAAGQYPLAASGGVILHQPLLRSQLAERLDESGQAPSGLYLVPDPVRGAVALARELLPKASRGK
jgi:N-acetylglucosamine kinase-like BadF-type ATPase